MTTISGSRKAVESAKGSSHGARSVLRKSKAIRRSDRVPTLSKHVIQFVNKLRIFFQRALEYFCLLFGGGPVSRFDGFGESGKFQVGVGESGAVEDVFEPGATGDAVGVEPVAFD